MIDKIRNAQNVENIVSDASKSEVVNFIVELQEERDTLRAELDSITDQLRAAKVEAAEEKRMKDSWFGHYENCYGNYHDALTQNMALRAELDKQKEQKPVAYIIQYDVDGVIETSLQETNELSYFCWQDGNGDEWPAISSTPLYAHPVPPLQVPEWLLEMSKQMREQDNRSTAHPFWQVRCKRYIVTEQGYNEHHWQICGDDGVIYRSIDPIEELYDYLIENHSDFVSYWNNENSVENLSEWLDPTDDHLPDGLRLIYVQEIEEIVTTHFTEHDARAFIARKQHDYPKLYTYVESAYWSPQLRKLQDWIISLSAAPTPPSDEV